MEKFIIYSKEYLDHYDRFIKYVEAIGYSEASCKTFNTSIRELLCWLEVNKIDAYNVTESDIETYYSYQQERPMQGGGVLSESRVELNMYVAKIFFQEMQDSGMIEIHPMSNIDYVSRNKVTRENLLTLDDMKKLYDICETARERSMLGILYGCGLRRQEAVQLDIRDVHFKSEMLYVREGKGGRKRTIPLSKSIVDDLKDYYYNERPTLINYSNVDTKAFILNSHGKRTTGESYLRYVKKLIAKAKLDSRISPHHFRHAIATHLLESGMKTEHVKDFLGHMSIETTQTYTHIVNEQIKQTTRYGATAISSRSI